MNRVQLIGRLTKDPDARQAGDKTIAQMRLAVSDYRDNAMFFDVVAWQKLAENCLAHLTKGRQIAVDGRLTWREHEKDGVKRQYVSITAENIDFLGGEKKQESLLDEPADAEEPIPFHNDGFPSYEQRRSHQRR